MSISQGYTFDNAGNFVLTNTQIESLKGKLGYIPLTGQLFNQNFSSDTGFTYDSAKAEFVGGVVRQKSQQPGALLAATYDVDADPITTEADLIWRSDAGSLSATLNGVPTIAGSKLSCIGSHGVRYGYNTSSTETIKLKYTPNYTGNAGANVNIFTIYNGTDNKDRFDLTNSPSGNNFRFRLYNSIGNVIIGTLASGNFAAVTGVEYEIEVTIDAGAGIVKIFLDGILTGTQSIGTWVRGSAVSQLWIGAANIVYNITNASFDDVIAYDNIQHTASYTPGYSIGSDLYLGSKVDGPNFSYAGVGQILSVDTGSTTETGSPRYIIGGMYWDGVSWVASDNTYAQANSFATALANFGAFVISGSTFPWSVVFTDSGLSQSSVDDFNVEVTGQQYATDGHMDPVQGIDAKALVSYSHVETVPALTGLGVILSVDGVLKYWDGAAWSTSDGTFAQSNSATVTNTNIAALTLGSNSTILVRWVFNTTDQAATATIETATIEYDFGAIATSTTLCEVYGYVKDISDNAIVGATVSFDMETVSNNSYQEASSRVMSTTALSVLTDSNGYFAISLIRTSQYTEGGTYNITIALPNGGGVIGQGSASKLTFEVPDSTTKDITDLLPA